MQRRNASDVPGMVLTDSWNASCVVSGDEPASSVLFLDTHHWEMH